MSDRPSAFSPTPTRALIILSIPYLCPDILLSQPNTSLPQPSKLLAGYNLHAATLAIALDLSHHQYPESHCHNSPSGSLTSVLLLNPPGASTNSLSAPEVDYRALAFSSGNSSVLSNSTRELDNLHLELTYQQQ